MEVHHQGYPKYAQEGTKEREILDGSRVFFTERDEKLRYDLVKRVFQWMLDTNENGTFGYADMADHDVWSRGERIRESNKEMKRYLWTLLEDVRTKCLTDEMNAVDEYVELIKPTLPEQYQERREFIHEIINPRDRAERLHKIGERYWYGVDPPESRWISI